MSSKKGQSAFDQYSTAADTASEERKQLFEDAHPYTHTDTVIKENKTKRTYGLVQPSVFEKVTKYAKATGTSYNDIVCELLDQFIADKGL